MLAIVFGLVLVSQVPAYSYTYTATESFDSRFGETALEDLPEGMSKVGDVVTYEIASFIYMFTDNEAFLRFAELPRFSLNMYMST